MRYRSPSYYFYLFYFIFSPERVCELFFFIALCVLTLVFELFIFIYDHCLDFFFILLVGVSICFHSYKLYIFIKAYLPNNTKDALKEYCAINPLDCTNYPDCTIDFQVFKNQEIHCTIFQCCPYIRNMIAQSNILRNHIERLGAALR